MEIKTPMLKCSFTEHLILKKEILSIINSSEADNVFIQNNSINDNIHRLDWNDSTNFNRKWVKIFKPHLENTLKKLVCKIGFTDVTLYNIWYQQYHNSGKHGWHTHGSNFTGVYYLDFNKEIHPKTDILNPSNPKEVISIDANEGDLIAFPAYYIHRGGRNLSHNSKTIISFNFDPKDVVFELIEN
jgi:hypothetical protein|tara:strand:- start:65 stop:622 length:558 start_codon:yes stop_codon:yes gene_type:complete